MMESISGIKQTSMMNTQTIPMTETIEKRNVNSAVPITSNTIRSTVQKQKYQHMKTATLPSSITGLDKVFIQKLSGVANAIAPQLFSHIFKRARPFKLLLIMLLTVMLGINRQGYSQGTQTFNYTGSSQTFTVPAGVTSITVSAWGGGGAGGGSTNAGTLTGRGGAGGGGGAYASSTLTVSPGTLLDVKVAGQAFGNSGASGNGGGNSTITGFEAQILASGGQGGTGNTSGGSPVGGAGGAIAASAGTTRTAGANGGNGATATFPSSASSGAGGAAANGGGAGGTSITSGTADGNPGSAPGGGGSGSRTSQNEGNKAGGAGAAGRIIITWTCPSNAGTLSGTQNIFIGGTTTFSSTVPGGTWSSGNNSIATINSSTGIITPVALGGPVIMTYTITGTGGCTTQTATRTVTVANNFTSGAISTSGETICSGGDPESIASTTAASGNGTITYQWQSGTDGINFTTTIANSNSATYDPPSGLTTKTYYRRQAQDSNTPFTTSTGVWAVTVNPNPTATVASKTNVACKSGTDGVITIHASGGTGAYSYSVDNGATWMPSATDPYSYGGLIANHLYKIMVKDANGCQSVSIP